MGNNDVVVSYISASNVLPTFQATYEKAISGMVPSPPSRAKARGAEEQAEDEENNES